MQITRRTFLKGAAKGVAASAVAATVGLKLDFEAWAAEQEEANVELKASLCNVCPSHCPMWVHVKNGRPWKVTGNEAGYRSKGKLCARAHTSFSLLYGNARVRTPLKKVAPGRFEPISWEQASDEIGAKLREAVDAGLGPNIFWGHNPRVTGGFYGPRFMNALGSRTVVTQNAACNVAMFCGFNNSIGAYPLGCGDMANSRFMLLIGRNYAEGIRVDQSIDFGNALRNPNTKIVCVDPRLSKSAALADEWIPIRPGTDLALLLGIANVLISEDLYDRGYIDNRTTGFEHFLAIIDQYTPEWAEEKTTIPADTIRRLAREMAEAAPAVYVDPSWKGAVGDNFENGTETVRLIAYVNALLGSFGQAGGIPSGHPPGPVALATGFGGLNPERHPAPPAVGGDVPRIDGAWAGGDFPLAPPQGLPHNIAKKALEGERIFGFIRHFNPVRNFPDYEHMSKGYEAIELLVVLDTHMTETGLVADYILPEPTFAEREEIVENHGESLITRSVCIPKIDPETKPMDEIVVLLAEKAGVGQYFNFTLRDLNRARLAPFDISLERLLEEGAINVPTVPVALPGPGFNEGRVMFYSQAFANNGFDGVAGWVEPITGYRPPSDNHFRPVIIRQGYHTHTSSADNPQLAQITMDYQTNRVWMNATVAARLGIRDNDMVELTSELGSERVRVELTEKIHPEVIGIPSHYGKKVPQMDWAIKAGGINTNDLVPFRLESRSGHSMMQETWVTVRRV